MPSGGDFDLKVKRDRLAELQNISQSPDFWNDTQRAQKISKELKLLQEMIKNHDERVRLIEDTLVLLELASESGDEESLQEVQTEIQKIQKEVEQAEFETMLSEPEDICSAVFSINAGAGGTESCDWAAMLLRMYLRFCEKKGYKTEIVDFTHGDGAGYRSVTVTAEGNYAFGYLKAEVGVHRLVRLSPFDANKRRHTSFASMFVYPLINDEIVIEIKPDDIKFEAFRAGGAGGRNVQKNETAVRITHIPSGIVVQCQNERSQHQNREVAMKILKSRLYEAELEKKRVKQKAIEETKQDNAWGSQIRSYVLHPYKMVKDHRTDYEVGDAESVLEGEHLDEFIKKYLLAGPVGN